MQTIQVQLPDTVNIDAQEIQILLAGKLYERGLLSVGQAAQDTLFNFKLNFANFYYPLHSGIA